MKLIFAGTPEIAATVLAGLIDSKYEICAVLTQPDRPAGRGQKLVLSPVKILALAHNIPVLQPLKLRELEIQQTLREFNADLMIVVAYGLIVPEAVLQIPKYGCWNVHVSLLPRWRGAAPIQRAIEAGDTKTGVTLMQMDIGLDTGPILLQEEVTITAEMTGGELHDLLAVKGRELLLQGLNNIKNLKQTLQPGIGVTYANKLNKEEAHIDWSEKAIDIERKIRAFNPWPVCYAIYNDEVIRILKARLGSQKSSNPIKPGQLIVIAKKSLAVQTAEGVLEILELQKTGGKVLTVEAFLNGHQDFFSKDALFI